MIQIPEHIDSKYRFVIISALRARQIQGGSMPMIKDSRHKSTQIAQRELLKDLVKFRIPSADDSPAAEETAEEE